MTVVAEQLDGRRLRREHNRAAVIDALIALFGEGVYQPSSAEVAERAGLSPRSLFRYFDDVDDLNHAAIEQQLAAARPLLSIGASPSDPLDVRIGRLVLARVRLFEAITPGARAVRITAHRHHVVAEQLAQSRSYLREQIRRLFATELAGERAVLLPAVDALCSFETYDLLRVDQKLSRPKVTTSLTDALTLLLAPTGETTP